MKGTIGFMFFMLFLAAFALVSLQSGQQAGAGDSSSGDPLTMNEWQAVRLYGNTVPGDAGVSVSFSGDGRLYGNAGCNRYNGRYEQGVDTFRIESMRATRKSCAEHLMIVEKSLFEMFRDARQTSLADGDLRFLDGEGDWLATFRTAETPAARTGEGT